MKFEFKWPNKTEVLEAEDAFLKLSKYKGENIAREIMDEVRWNGGSWPFTGLTKETIASVSFKGI